MSPSFLSRPPAGFTALAVLRGMQLTFVGGLRVLGNPQLARSGFYRKAVVWLGYSLGIQLMLWAPLYMLKWTLYALQFVARADKADSIESLIDTLQFLQHISNLGPLVVSAVRYLRPEMDELFILSLQYVDFTYKQKHPETNREYGRAVLESGAARVLRVGDDGKQADKHQDKLGRFVQKVALKMLTMVAAYAGAHVPVIGRAVVPLVCFMSLRNGLGDAVAAGISAFGLVLPKRAMLMFISGFWGSRRLVREVLAAYFSRVPFTPAEREAWFRAREGIMFGFAAGLYLLMRIPFVGVLVYGFCQASAAYLVTKVTDPPPFPSDRVKFDHWVQRQVQWTKDL